MKDKHLYYKVYLALIAGLILIGVSPILIKLANAPGIMSSFYRMAIGVITLTPIFIINYIHTKPNISLRGILWAIFGGICLGTDMAFWSTGIMASNATFPTLAANLTPLWVGIGAIFFFKEKHSWGFWSGVILTIIGVFLLVIKQFTNAESTGIIKGVLFGAIAGIFYAAYQMATQVGRKKLNTLTFLYVSTLATAITTAIIALLFKLDFTGYPTSTWLYWIAMGIGIQFIGWFLINYSQGTLPATVVAPTLLGQPIVTALIEVFVLRNSFNIWQIIGGIVIVTGIYIVHTTRTKFIK